jgi:hypothetical protein
MNWLYSSAYTSLQRASGSTSSSAEPAAHALVAQSPPPARRPRDGGAAVAGDCTMALMPPVGDPKAPNGLVKRPRGLSETPRALIDVTGVICGFFDATEQRLRPGWGWGAWLSV